MKPGHLALFRPEGAARQFPRGIATAQAMEPEASPFHPHKIFQGTFLRGGCMSYQTHGLAILYIRAKDTKLDWDALGGIAGQLEMRLSPAGELLTANSGITVRVTFHQNRAHSVYAVGAYSVPGGQLTAARRIVERIAEKLFEMKEEPQFSDNASLRFRTDLAGRTGYL
jgi:hypothetical protein